MNIRVKIGQTTSGRVGLFREGLLVVPLTHDEYEDAIESSEYAHRLAELHGFVYDPAGTPPST